MTILTTLSCTITTAGIVRPSYADILETLQSRFQSIYGTDSYLAPDSQDGQLLAVFAKAIDDSNALAVLVYNAYSPATAQGAALSNNVKINGIARNVATRSTAAVLIGGTVGTAIARGVVGDDAGNRWNLPHDVVIPMAGEITVIVTSDEFGAFNAPMGTINQILNPTLGWQTAISTAPSIPGVAIETDAALRRRQNTSVALPSRTVLAGILGAVQAVEGVTRSAIYENDTAGVDANGLPPHSIAVVVLGGDANEIATAITNKKTPGAYTYGTELVEVTDVNGIHYNIRYFIPTQRRLSVQITVKALPRYSEDIGAAIKQALADYINSLNIGQRVDLGRLYLPAQFFGQPGAETFEVNEIRVGVFPAAPIPVDVNIAFDEIASLDVSDVDLIVTLF